MAAVWFVQCHQICHLHLYWLSPVLIKPTLQQFLFLSISFLAEHELQFWPRMLHFCYVFFKNGPMLVVAGRNFVEKLLFRSKICITLKLVIFKQSIKCKVVLKWQYMACVFLIGDHETDLSRWSDPATKRRELKRMSFHSPVPIFDHLLEPKKLR